MNNDFKIRITAEFDSAQAKSAIQQGLNGIENKTVKINADSSQIKNATTQMKKLNQEAKEGQTIWNKLGYEWKKAFASFTMYSTVTTVFYQSINAIRMMVTEVAELDASLVELRKVTDLSGSSLEEFTQKAYEASANVAKTGTDMIDAATEFAKAGYSEDDILRLGEIALMYTNIADEEVAVGDSANFMIAQMKAFNIEASDAMHIIDAVNEVANKFAVSSADIANNLGNSSAVMANAGNSYEEMIGLLTAGTEITRNASKVSNGLKTITLRMQGMNDEGEKDLELVAQMQGLYNKLGISVYDANGELKNTFELLRTLAPIYQEATAAEKAYITETIAGKYQAQNAAAILNNFETAIAATETAMNSNGSAMKENAVYLDSIEGKFNQLKAAFEEFSNAVISSDLVKWFIDLGTNGLNFLNSSVGKTVTTILALVAAFKLGEAALKLFMGANVVSKLRFNLNYIAAAFNSVGGGIKGVGVAAKAGIGLINPYVAALVVATGALLAFNAAQDATIQKLEEQAEAIQNAFDKAVEERSSIEAEIESLKSLQTQLKDSRGNKSALLSVQTQLNEKLGTNIDLIYDEKKGYEEANYLIEQNIKLKEKAQKINDDKVFKTAASNYYGDETQIYDTKNLYGDKPFLSMFNQIAAGDNITGKDLDPYIESYFNMIDKYGEEASKKWDEFWKKSGTYTPDFNFIKDAFNSRVETMKTAFSSAFSENASGIFDESFFNNALETMVGKGATPEEIQKSFQLIFDNIDLFNKKIQAYQLAIKNGGTGDEEWADFLEVWNNVRNSQYPLPYIFTPELRDTIYANGQEVKEFGDAYQQTAEETKDDSVFAALFQDLDEVSDKYKDFYNNLKDMADEGSITKDSISDLIEETEGASEWFEELGVSIDDIYNYFAHLNEAVQSVDLEKVNKQIDEIQSAYDSLTAAMAEYNEQGYWNIDTLQTLSSLGWEYLQYLFDENGQLSLNEQGFRNLAIAQLELLKVKQAEELLNYAESLAAEGNQLKQTKTDVDNLTKALSDNNVALAANIALNEANSGEGDFTPEEVDAIYARAKQINSFVQQINATIGKVSTGATRISTSGSSSSKKSSSTPKKTSSNEKEWWETELEKLKDQFKYNEITIEEYINGLSGLLGKLQQGTEAWKKVNEELQKQRLNKVEDDYKRGVISVDEYINKLKELAKAYKQGTEAWNELADKIKEGLQDKLDQQKDDLETAEDAAIGLIDEEIEKLEELRDAEEERYDKLIEEKEKANEETEKEIELARLQEALENAKNEKTKRVECMLSIKMAQNGETPEEDNTVGKICFEI